MVHVLSKLFYRNKGNSFDFAYSNYRYFLFISPFIYRKCIIIIIIIIITIIIDRLIGLGVSMSVDQNVAGSIPSTSKILNVD